VSKTAITIPAFGGINKQHNRDLGQPSRGKNFWTRGGALFTREGSSFMQGTPFVQAVKSIHAAARVGVATRLLVEEGSNLWVKPSAVDPWLALRNNVTGSGFSSAVWQGFLLLFSGAQMLSYDITGNTVADITNTEGPVPAMQHVMVEQDLIWGWAPTLPEGNLVRFNGYLKDAQGFILGRSQNVWPPDFALDISGNSGTPVLDVIPYRGFRYCLTQVGSHLIYGENETNFRIVPGDNVGVFRTGCSALVNSVICWLGVNIKGHPRVYAFTGTEPIAISQPIEELLIEENFTNVWAKALGNQFWLIFPKEAVTTCYVYDTDERQWYVHEFPIGLWAGTLFAEHLQPLDIHFGAQGGKVLRLDTSMTDFGVPITTELYLGPFSLESRRIRLKRLWLEAEPRRDFFVDVFAAADQGEERGPFRADVFTGNPVRANVRVQGVRGRSVFLRLTTTEKIDELQQASLTVAVGGVR